MMGDRRAKLIAFLILCSLSVTLITIEAVRAAENSWTIMEPMPTANGWLGVAVVNGKIYAIGGGYGSTSINEYDPVTDTWTTKTPMPTPRIFFGIAVVENKIYTIGGDRGNWEIGAVLTSVNEVYDPMTDTWERRSIMPTKRLGVSASVVNDKIYLIGGRIGEPTYAEVSATEVYNPSTDKWTTVEPIPTPVSSHISAVVNNKIYILGGAVGVTLNQIYDTETDTWSNGAPLPTGVDSAAAGVITGDTVTQRIFVIGGKQNLDAVNLNQVYTPESDTWIAGPPILTGRYGLGVAVVEDNLYAIGGREGWIGSPISATNERYTPADYSSEFPSWIILPILIASTLVVIIVRNKIRKKGLK